MATFTAVSLCDVCGRRAAILLYVTCAAAAPQFAPRDHTHLVCAGDTAFGADEFLPYGESITAGVPLCESAESGATRRDDPASHSFIISRQTYQPFLTCPEPPLGGRS